MTRRRRLLDLGAVRELACLGAGIAVVIAALRSHPVDPTTLAIGIGLLVGPPAVAATRAPPPPPPDPGGNP